MALRAQAQGAGAITQTGPLTITANGAASTPAELVNGTWFTGGSSTTTKPQVLIEPTGATSASWSTAGTGLGVNYASGFTGNIVDFQANGTSVFNIASTGNLFSAGNAQISGNVTAGAAGYHAFLTSSLISAPANGQILLQNAAATAFTRLQFGGTTSSFPAIKVNGTALNFRLSDDSADTSITAASGSFSGKSRNTTSTALGTTGTISLDPTLGEVFTTVPTGAITLNAASAAIGTCVTLVVTTSGASSFNITFNTNFKSTGVLATGTVTAKVFTVTFIGDGTNLNELSRTTAM